MYEEKNIKWKKSQEGKNKKKGKALSNKSQKNEKISLKKVVKEKSIIPFIFKEINYKQLGYKLLLLLFIMNLLIFTISRIKKYHVLENENFYTNADYLLKTSLKYFQENQFPQNVGDSASFLLEEMRNLNLIEDIKDKDQKFCNYLDSYILLTKTALKEYRMKIHLKCQKKEYFLEKNIICSNHECSILN